MHTWYTLYWKSWIRPWFAWVTVSFIRSESLGLTHCQRVIKHFVEVQSYPLRMNMYFLHVIVKLLHFWEFSFCFFWKDEIQVPEAVADPGFFRGGAPTPKSAIVFKYFCRKLHENERI